jgi:hypothetical protein
MGYPEAASVSDDCLADICPICGEEIADDDEWTKVEDGLAHLRCIEKGKPEIDL